eukprot:4410185-Lingulodinium_polyedra.AAC.1
MEKKEVPVSHCSQRCNALKWLWATEERELLCAWARLASGATEAPQKHEVASSGVGKQAVTKQDKKCASSAMSFFV